MIYIAEIGNNHNGNIELAKKMADAAISSGSDYVKFQVYNIDKFINRASVYYKDFLTERLSFDAFKELKKHVELNKGRFLATPFDEDSLMLLHEMGLGTIKISSGDVNNKQLIGRAIDLGKNLIISVGGATLKEIDEMVNFLEKSTAKFSILHCIIDYPAKFQELNLNFITTLKKRYSCPVGYSDHSPGIEASLAAIALGAEIVEKHFTIDRTLPGGDNQMSVLPDEFKRLRREGSHIEEALGSLERKISKDELEVKKLIRRKFVAKRDILRNSPIGDEDLLLLRTSDPDAGFEAGSYAGLISKRALRDIKRGELITKELIGG